MVDTSRKPTFIFNQLWSVHDYYGEYFNMDGHIRLGFACSEDVLRSGLNALGNGLKELS